MKSKLTKILIPFILTTVFNFAFSSDFFLELGIVNMHIGLFYILGLLFGIYGAIGTVLGDITINLLVGADPQILIISAISSFGATYLAYKLWYSGFKTDKITKPKLDNSYHLTLFLSSILICGFVYSAINGNLMDLYTNDNVFDYLFVLYFLNFINFAFIFGIIGIWLSEKIGFIEIPKKSKKSYNKKLYQVLFLLMLISGITAILLVGIAFDTKIAIALTGILLFAYLTKPFEYDVEDNDKATIIEKIMRNFLLITFAIAILGIIVSLLSHNYIMEFEAVISPYLYLMPMLIITDLIMILFFIPGIIILRYIEKKVIKPISSFSEIEGFILEDEKIEAERLLDIYSKYVDEDNEIGTLARSYSELINHNNHYIENLRQVEGEKERMNAELDIATKIQASTLPTEAIENDDFIVAGYSHPAKEVGGDFFDYYELDEDNLTIVIGDASGKGVPAALVAMITQVMIKQMLEHDRDPSKVLYSLNNQLCENNPESMFITLWLGIYNKTTKKLTYSNAGHNPPLIKENGEFRYSDIDPGIVIGIMEDYDYIVEEITLANELVLYTDGITDANNDEDEIYGEKRLLDFLNGFESDEDPITPLLNDINNFTGNQEQFDDMTLVDLKIK